MWARRSLECLSSRLTGVKQFTLGKKLRFRAPGASGRTQRGCCPAKEVEETGLTINIVDPGGGANTPGRRSVRDEPAKAASRASSSPDEMIPPLLYIVSREADNVNGCRFGANLWTRHCRPPELRDAASRTAGFGMHPQPT